MDGEAIFGMIIMSMCSFGCAAAFFGIGAYAAKRKDPMHFWTGSAVDPKSISDIPAYNRANGKLWKWYSVPYWLSGILALFGLSVISAILLFLAATVGCCLLVAGYNQILKRYKA